MNWYFLNHRQLAHLTEASFAKQVLGETNEIISWKLLNVGSTSARVAT